MERDPGTPRCEVRQALIVLFREVAEAEVEAAWRRYADLDERVGVQFLEEVDAALMRAAEAPAAYQLVVGELRHGRLRRFPHALYFRVIGKAIVVVACFHPARDPARLASRS